MDFNNFIRQIGIPIPVTEEEEKSFPFLCSNNIENHHPVLKDVDNSTAAVTCQHRVQYDDERCRCYRCGKLMCDYCLKRKSKSLLCHEPNHSMKFDVCILCIPHITVENLWHEQWERSLPSAKLRKYQQEIAAASSLTYSPFVGLSFVSPSSASVTSQSTLSNDPLTNMNGCRCGSQFVVEKTAFKFSGSGMYQHCRNQEAAIAFLMTIGCRALASFKIVAEASQKAIDLNRDTQIKGSILDDPELEINSLSITLEEDANDNASEQQSVDTKTLEDGSTILDNSQTSLSSSNVSSLNQSSTPSLERGSGEALESTITAAIDYKKEWRKAKEILLRAKRFREQEIEDEKANRLNYEKEVEVTSYWGDTSI